MAHPGASKASLDLLSSVISGETNSLSVTAENFGLLLGVLQEYAGMADRMYDGQHQHPTAPGSPL